MNTPHTRFSQHPLAQICATYSVGILAANYLLPPLWFVISCLAICSLASLILLITGRPSWSAVALLLAAFFSGSILFILENRNQHTSNLRQSLVDHQINMNQPVTLQGVIVEPAVFARSGVYFSLKVESVITNSEEWQGSGVVSVLAVFKDKAGEQAYRDLQLNYGTRLTVKATLTWVDKYRNPGVPTLSEYLDRNGYDATGFVKSPGSIIRLSGSSSFDPLSFLYQSRDRFQSRIDSLFSPETAGVLDAALLGNRYNLLRSTAERFRMGGTFHVLVISGLHISFLGGLVLLTTRRITKSRLAQFSVSNVIVWGYSLGVGAGPSVTRAAVMFSFVSFATVVFRHASSLNALGGAGLTLLVWSPRDVFDPSLQLTFLSVLAIVAIAWPILNNLNAVGGWRPTRTTPYPPSCSRPLTAMSEMLYWGERDWKKEMSLSGHQYLLFKTPAALQMEKLHLQGLLRYVFAAVLVSLSVQTVLLPFLILYFHRVSLSSLLLNIVVSMMLAILIGMSVLALAVDLFSHSLATLLAYCADKLNWLMVHSVDPFSHFAVASFRLPHYSGWARLVYFFYFLPLLVIGYALDHWNPLALPSRDVSNQTSSTLLAGALQVLMCVVILAHPLSAVQPDGKLHVDFLDVGQGDSALITMPDGTYLLVDGGGRPNFLNASVNDDQETTNFERESRSIGESVVSQYLWGRGLSTVDYVLATHADADHIDGLNDVVRNFSVRSAIVGRAPLNDPEYAKFFQTLSETGIPMTIVQSGDRISVGNVDMEVLWPPATSDQNAPSRNNDSVVLRLQFGQRVILLTGDIEKDAEKSIVNGSSDLRADVVKVPHHGSRTSSTESFAAATQPSTVVISVGLTSMFGHPHKDVVERWQSHGAQVVTTGNCGMISLTTDGTNLWIKKFVVNQDH